ncbi:methylaspartate mutase [candidate division KD3-62 bacterium DG_56]|uniref:Methylaspartate mutase n=1 Tax=candidate division KD3-62 bacterium DG_56 TaxID=1704032 RepID=A0A0S7XPY0_9BACT|nr:MAG: methylaspartate mutase [candidate division KD3-62 bacterium DG_56]
MQTIIAIDCGSTTTKAILIERHEEGFRLVARGEAPTTVESPHDDVTVGVLNAVGELEDLTGRRFLQERRILTERGADGSGVDLLLSTSSAGGGLQMLVSGVVKSMTAESAQRAALGAGAIVVDVLAVDDGRADHDKIERIRGIRPDMILMSGGTDGGTTSHLLDMSEMIRAADPKPRLGHTFRLPLIYAGNVDARKGVREVLGGQVELIEVANLRPVLEREDLGPAREAIHRLFLDHVMAQAPGYDKLLSWAHAPIMATPRAVGEMVRLAARMEETSVLAVDIGGATTDVFSVFGDMFNRTVSANLGMSYSVGNVLAETGTANIGRWMPFAIDDALLRNGLRNKMIRPTTIPQQIEDLLLEQAVAREALRLALAHHRELAVTLAGVQQERTIADAFTQATGGESLVRMMQVGLIIGSGGVLSHAPRREQAAMMMIDAFQPEGVTALAVDSIFMMPQLGVLASVLPDAAKAVFQRDCLIPLGAVIAPVGGGRAGQKAISLQLTRSDGEREAMDVNVGELTRLPLAADETAIVRIEPSRGWDVGAGAGRPIEAEIAGGAVGLIIDARGRPLELPLQDGERCQSLERWLTAAGALPEAVGSA